MFKKEKILFDIRLFCHIELILKNLEYDIFKNYIYVFKILQLLIERDLFFIIFITTEVSVIL